MNNEELIKEVYKRKPLWDVRCKAFRQQFVTRKLWEEVAEALNLPRESCKRRWKSIKDNYRVELKKMKTKTNNGDVSVKSKWSLFDNLKFLSEIMSVDTVDIKNESICYINDPLNITSEIKSDINESTQNQDVITENSFLIMEYDDDKSQQNHQMKTITKTLKRKITNTNEKDPFIEIEKEKLKILKEDRQLQNDPDYNFLISFLPHMKKMSEINNLKFRLEMSKILLQVKEEEETQCAEVYIPTPSTSAWETKPFQNDENEYY